MRYYKLCIKPHGLCFSLRRQVYCQIQQCAFSETSLCRELRFFYEKLGTQILPNLGSSDNTQLHMQNNMNPGFLGSLTRQKHVRVLSEFLKHLSVLLGFLNLHGFSLNKAQLSLHLEVNSHLVAESNIPWHWLFVISLTQANSNCNFETFVK